MTYDARTVAIVLATGAAAIATVFASGAIAGLTIYGARCIGHHIRTQRARNTR